METPLWLPEQRALVFADAFTAPGGELRVWDSPAHAERALPALRALLELPFELVILAHGEPGARPRRVRARARAGPVQPAERPGRAARSVRALLDLLAELLDDVGHRLLHPRELPVLDLDQAYR